MDFQFDIPHNSLELLNSDGNKYFVKQVHDARDLPDLLKVARNSVTNANASATYIFDHFDTYFSLIENASPALLVSMMRGLDLIYLTIDKEGRELLEFFNQTNVDPVERETHLNLTKMVIYLCVGFIRTIDSVTMESSAADLGGGKKGGKRGTGGGDLDVHNWEERRFKSLVQLMNFFQMPLEKLWSLCIAEENFVDLICGVCYRTLEHPSAKEKRVGDTVFQILGTAIKRYNHAMTFPVKIVHLLCTSELAVIPATHGLYHLYTEFGIKAIFATVLKDFVDAVGLAIADAHTVKNFSVFLTEVGALDAKMMIPLISEQSEEMLNLDSYTLRNCVLQMMGDAITNELSSENLADDMREYREEFLEDLHMHLIDTSAQVRSKTLQVWNHMKTENSVPLAWQQKVLESAAERLDDRSVLVRKNAVILIKSFLETNPFAANLSVKELEEKFESERSKLEAIREKMVASQASEEEVESMWSGIVNDVMAAVSEELSQATQEVLTEMPSDYPEVAQEISKLLMEKNYAPAVKMVRRIDVVNREARVNLDFNDQVGYYTVLLHSYLFIDKGFSEEFTTQERTLTFLEDSLRFAQVVNRVVPIIENMLMSKINTDVFEAIDLFTTAYLFGIRGTERGMRRMLALVWSGDKEKREAVTKAYHRVLFQTDQTGRGHTIKVVSNLCSFFEHLDVGQFSATEVLMQEWIDNEDINSQIIQVLFERMTHKLEDTTNNVSRLSLLLLVMAATVKPSIASSNFDLVQSIAYGDRCYEDPRIFADCLALLTRHTSGEQGQTENRHEKGSELIDKAFECYQRLFFHPDTPNFDNITTKTMDFFYKFGETPDVLCEQLLTLLCQRMEQITAKNQPPSDEGDPATQSLFANNNKVNQLPDYIMIRLIHLVGYVALKEMVFLDVHVYSHMKYWKEVEDEKKKGSASKRKTINHSMSASASKALKRLSETNNEQQEDDLLDGATAEDTIAEMINEVIEDKLLYDPKSLLGKFIPIVMEILKSPAKFRDERLQQAGCLALIRLMTISMKFCETNMPFLMNVMAQTKNVRNKCNIIVGLCDLTFRFPNVIQLWTSHIYETLHEKNDQIRLTAVKVLSHLIQHEMIRVKGQISDLAMCIIDPNQDIRNIAQEFFKEIAQKSNILYNVLPDIISRLSGTSVNLQEEQYHVIMKHVMGLIQKDRQVETLVEKLCLRFKVTNEERQWRDIAFCLSLLNYTEKTIKKLIEHVPYFKDKVQVDEVYESFKTIINNTGKMAKPEMKAVLVIFGEKLEECLAVREAGAPGAEGSQGGATGDDDAKSRSDMPPPKRIPKSKGKQKGKAKARNNSDSDSDEEHPRSRGRGKSQASQVRNSARKVTKKAAIIDTDSSSSDEDTRSKRHR